MNNRRRKSKQASGVEEAGPDLFNFRLMLEYKRGQLCYCNMLDVYKTCYVCISALEQQRSKKKSSHTCYNYSVVYMYVMRILLCFTKSTAYFVDGLLCDVFSHKIAIENGLMIT